MSFWREAGLTYVQAANIAARALRNVLKNDVKVQAVKREEQYVKAALWQNGKQGETKILDASGNKLGH
ncbi:hypothetical protein HK097_002764 [Rhizophlyctis rosea]|uniref:Uncharacterized protein n=1 Tax=Rhizophlyctis rosea TaxID=64517 RepID=A0AAD5S312_9FUNG|nr:hypothetical protein HK097_002764 [Rhizophlyctis rosea]